jgi:ATP-dependent RNA helicase DHX37/DHR1
VVDSGQEKHRYHEGVWKWRKGWGSRAMAEQRAGRAGRTTHGYCYRLYSAALYANIMEEYPLPEISKLPLEGVLLQLKAIGIPNAFSFPFPTAPLQDKIKNSLLSLRDIKALEGPIEGSTEATTITELGNVLSFLPLDPKLAKILLLGRKANVAKHSLLLVILLTVESIFLDDFKADARVEAEESDQKARYLEEMRAKASSFRSTYKQFIMEGHNGDIFTSINILGHFFGSLFKEHGNVLQKVRRLSNNLQLNENVMRDIYFNTDQIAEIYETLSGERIDLATYTPPTLA